MCTFSYVAFLALHLGLAFVLFRHQARVCGFSLMLLLHRNRSPCVVGKAAWIGGNWKTAFDDHFYSAEQGNDREGKAISGISYWIVK